MELNGVMEKLKAHYSNHDDFDEMMTDLGDNTYIDHWANKLCSEHFNQNKELAKELYKIQLKACESCNDFSSLADSVISEDNLADKVWAKEIYLQAIELAEDSSDFCSIANSIVLENNLFDKEWASTLYDNAIEKATSTWDYISIAESLAEEEKINDKNIAKDVYKKAINVSDCASDFQSIALSLVDDSYMNDKEWAITIMQQALNSDDINYNDAKSIAYDIVNKFDDKEWAKTVYQQAIDLCDDDEERKEVITDINDDLEDKHWVTELLEEYDITLSSDEDEDEDDIEISELDFDEFEIKRVVVRISPTFLWFEVEELIDENEEDGIKKADELLKKFISDLSDKFEGNIENSVLLSSYNSKELYEYDDGIGKVDLDGANIDLILTKEIPADIFNSLLLDMDEYSFSAMFPDHEGSIISQSYESGEYDTGYFATKTGYYPDEDLDSYIDYNVEYYNHAKDTLLENN